MNYFLKFSTIQELPGIDGIPEIQTDFTFDLIDLPYFCCYRSDGITCSLTMYLRRKPDGHDTSQDPFAEIEYDLASGDLSGHAEDPVREDAAGFITAAVILAAFVEGNNLAEEFPAGEADDSGLLIEDEEDSLNVTIVTGHDRPELQTVMDNGSLGMIRPYPDEYEGMEDFDTLSFEEKIELARAGNWELMNQIQVAYSKGSDEVEQDSRKAFLWALEWAEKGVSLQMYNVGLAYAKGCGCERDLNLAADWMERSRDAGDPDAGDCAKEYRAAAEWYEKAKAGDASMQAAYAHWLASSSAAMQFGSPEDDYKEALFWAKKSAAQGNAAALAILAEARQHGHGVEQDEEKAAELYWEAAEKGFHAAWAELAVMATLGEGMEPDVEKAVEWLNRAICEDEDAVSDYASKCLNGELLTDAAVEVLSRLTEQGSLKAAGILAIDYKAKANTLEKVVRAIRFYEDTAVEAVRADANLAHLLSNLYIWVDNGKVVDLELSTYWNCIAAQHGDPASKSLFQAMLYMKDFCKSSNYEDQIAFLHRFMEEPDLLQKSSAYAQNYTPDQALHDRLYAAWCSRYPLTAAKSPEPLRTFRAKKQETGTMDGMELLRRVMSGNLHTHTGTEFRCMVRFRDSEQMTQALELVHIEDVNGGDHSLAEIEEIFHWTEERHRMLEEDAGFIFESMYAEEGSSVLEILDLRKDPEYFEELAHYLLDSLMTEFADDIIFVADWADKEDADAGNSFLCYFGGGVNGILSCCRQGSDAVRAHFHYDLYQLPELMGELFNSFRPALKKKIKDFSEVIGSNEDAAGLGDFLLNVRFVEFLYSHAGNATLDEDGTEQLWQMAVETNRQKREM